MARNVRTIHVITGLGQGGAETAMARLVSGIGDTSQTLVVSLTTDGVFGARLRERGIGVASLGLGSLVSAPWAVLRLARLILRSRADVVQTWMYHADLIGGLAARIAGRPVCWGVRASNFSPAHNKASTIRVAKICARLSGVVPNMIVSCSAAAIDLHRSIGYADRFALIPNGYDFDALSFDAAAGARVRTELGLSEDEIIGHVARADPLKDHPTLLSAFALVAAARPRARLLMAGSGLERGDPYFDALVAGHPFADRILGLGRRDDVRAVMSSMDVFALSSVGEAFPNVVAEAMACEVPCVVTDVGDAAFIVGETGRVVPPSDPAALADALTIALQESRADRRKRGASARADVVDRYDLDRMIGAYRALWAGVAERGRPASVGWRA